MWHGTCNMYISIKYEQKVKYELNRGQNLVCSGFFLLNLIVLEFFRKSQILKHSK